MNKMRTKTKFVVSYDNLLQIFSYLDIADLCCVARVCKMFARAASVDLLWINKCSPGWEFHSEFQHTQSWKQKYMVWLRYQINLWKIKQQEKSTLKSLSSSTPFSDNPVFVWNPPNINIERPVINLLVVGDCDVGKSEFLSAFVQQRNRAPNGVNSQSRAVKIDDKYAKVYLWDAYGGPERFRTLAPNYYKMVVGFIVMYDVCDEKTFLNVAFWMSEIGKKSLRGNSVLLVGNKCESWNRKVATKQGEELAAYYGIPFIEISAARGINNMTAVEIVIIDMIRKNKQESESFGLITEYGWPQVIPTLESVQRVLAPKRVEIVSSHKKDKCNVQ